MTEAEIRELEEQFPYLADAAFAEAYKRALANAQSVLVVRNSILYRDFPDGTSVPIRAVEHPYYYPVGTIINLR